MLGGLSKSCEVVSASRARAYCSENSGLRRGTVCYAMSQYRFGNVGEQCAVLAMSREDSTMASAHVATHGQQLKLGRGVWWLLHSLCSGRLAGLWLALSDPCAGGRRGRAFCRPLNILNSLNILRCACM